MSEEYRVAVVGATGVVGREIAAILGQRQFPLQELRLLASEQSLGRTADVGDSAAPVDLLQEGSFGGIDIAFFCAGTGVTRRFAEYAVSAGAVVIDTSSHFVEDPEIPLVVPEVNAHLVRDFSRRSMISSPASSSLALAVAVKPIDTAATAVRVTIASYQAASGMGRKGIEDLSCQTAALLGGQPLVLEDSVFPRRAAFNCIPQVGEFTEDGQTDEEVRVGLETRRLLGRGDLAVAATCVQVPVFFVHCLAISLETNVKIEIDDALALLREAPGLVLCDGKNTTLYSTPADVAGTDATYVGRVRTDPSCEKGLLMWVASDNIRKGAALNAVQIAEILVREYL